MSDKTRDEKAGEHAKLREAVTALDNPVPEEAREPEAEKHPRGPAARPDVSGVERREDAKTDPPQESARDGSGPGDAPSRDV